MLHRSVADLSHPLQTPWLLDSYRSFQACSTGSACLTLLTPMPVQECLLANDVEVRGSATASRLASLLFLRRCLIFSGVSAAYVSETYRANDEMRSQLTGRWSRLCLLRH